MRLWTIADSVVFLPLVLLMGCGGTSTTSTLPATPDPTNEPSSIARPNELRYLALGDSYTIGQSVVVAERWPVQLVQRLREAGVNIADPEIVARTGWTTEDLAAGIETANPQGPFDIVSLLIGVNNQFRGLDIDQYRTEFAALLQRALAFAGDKPANVIVVSIPDWGVTPFAVGIDGDRIAKEINLYNMINKEQAARVGATYIDITGISRLAEADRRLLADDGLHPSGDMYGRWVELVLPAALAISTSPRT